MELFTATSFALVGFKFTISKGSYELKRYTAVPEIIKGINNLIIQHSTTPTDLPSHINSCVALKRVLLRVMIQI